MNRPKSALLSTYTAPDLFACAEMSGFKCPERLVVDGLICHCKSYGEDLKLLDSYLTEERFEDLPVTFSDQDTK